MTRNHSEQAFILFILVRLYIFYMDSRERMQKWINENCESFVRLTLPLNPLSGGFGRTTLLRGKV